MNKEDKLKKLKEGLGALEKKYGDFKTLNSSDKRVYDVIPTGSIGLNQALGIGGVPKGRIVELFGWESSGKTSVAMHIIAESQKKGGICAFIDAEHAFDPEYAKNIGINLDELYFYQPSSGEEALNLVTDLLKQKVFDVIVVDSVAALTPLSEIEGQVGDSKIGLQARMLSQAMRIQVAEVATSNTCLIYINQFRQKIGVMFGSPDVTSGGNALKFFASIRMEISRSTTAANSIVEKDVKMGNLTKVHITKNKCGAPFKKCEFNILYGVGIDKYGELIELARSKEIIKHRGKKISYEDFELEGSSKEEVLEQFIDILKDNPEMFNEIVEKCISE